MPRDLDAGLGLPVLRPDGEFPILGELALNRHVTDPTAVDDKEAPHWIQRVGGPSIDLNLVFLKTLGPWSLHKFLECLFNW